MKRFMFAVSLCVAMPVLAQAPADVLKVGTLFTFERANKVDGNQRPIDERWTFTQKVESVGEGVTVTEVGRSGQPRSTTVMRDLMFPLTVGKEWKHDFSTERVSAYGQVSTYRYDGKAAVVAEENLDLAGQTLKTLRVEIRGWINRSGGGQAYSWNYERIDWYSPALGYVVQSAYKEVDKGRTLVDASFRLTKAVGP